MMTIAKVVSSEWKSIVRLLPRLALALTLLSLSSIESKAEFIPNQDQARPFVIKGVLEVRFSDDVTVSHMTRSFGRVSAPDANISAVFTRHHVSDIEAVFPLRKESSAVASDRSMSKFRRISVPESADLDLLISELMATGKVESAEKVWAVPVMVIPDDPMWTTPGQYGPVKIQADLAWDLETGSDIAKIAIADTGVNHKHPDLKGNIWVNPGEDLDGDAEVYDTDDLNGIDDDGNGIIDDLIGYDFFTGLGGGVFAGEDGGGQDSDPDDFNGHGTHVAGIAAASSNNGQGVAGIAGGWNPDGSYPTRGARIMCLRIGATGTDGLGYVNLSNAASAIDYASIMGADVVNCSWGSASSTAMLNALNLAADSGVSIAKAAGNAGDEVADYMGTFSGVIAVASTDVADGRSSFSSFGTWIEISAPGTGIQSTYSFQYAPGYASIGGTSMAAPHYAGAVGIVKSVMPSWKRQQIDSLLMATADNIDAQNMSIIGKMGAGRLNVFNAIQNLPHADFSAGPTLLGAPGLNVDFTDLSPNSPTAWTWTFGDGNGSTVQNPSHVYSANGVYDVTLEVSEPNGTGYEQANHLVVIHTDSMGGDTVEALLGEIVTVPIYLNNTFQVKSIIIPIKYQDANGVKLAYNSFSTSGLRTEDWELQLLTSFDPFGKGLVIELVSNIGLLTNGHSRYLEPDTGAVLNLMFVIDPTSTTGADIPIISSIVSGKELSVTTIHGVIQPTSENMIVSVAGCCIIAGDSNHSGSVNISDATFLIAYIFSGGAAPDCLDEGDANGTNAINISDATYIIGYIFSGGADPICGTTGI